MDLKTFLEHFDTIAEAPSGLPKLRSLILDLAVRGKLVPQNPDDEPAEKLLKVIFNKHIAFGKKFRKPKDLPPIENIDKPFELPYGWCWCRFTEIGQLERGRSKHRPRNEPALYKDGSIPLVQTGDVARANGLITTYTALYNEKGLAQSRLWSKGTLCITIAANIADSAILGFDACFPDSIVGFLPTEPISDSRYFEFFIRTLKSHLEDFAPSTAQKNINLAILDEVLIPLPPLAEQKRIVEKVDELMGLCDRLSSAKQTRDNLRQKLRESAIASLMNAETDQELEKGWAIVRDNWCEVSQCPEDVSGLRKSVLELAVRGKLVPQDSEDCKAKSEIEEIVKRTKELERSGQLSKQKKPLPLSNELPYSIPQDWSWTRFVKVASIESNLVKPDNFLDYPHIAPNYIEKGTGKLLPYQTVAADKVTSPKHWFHPGQIVYSKIRPNLNKVTIVDFEGLCSADMYPISTGLYPRYLLLFMLSQPFINQVTSGDNRLAMPKVNQDQLSQVLVAVPPIAEQKRIVAKVDELMKLCDKLEASLRQSQQQAESLAASAISHLTL